MKMRMISIVLEWISFFNQNWAGTILMNWFTIPRTGKAFYFPESFDREVVRRDLLTSLGSSMATYRWPSEGNVVLLLHGWESNASRWHSLAKLLLEKGFAPVAIDAPAHGRSEEKSFNVLKYAAYIKTAVDFYQPQAIIGHSAGGMATVVGMKNWDGMIKAGVILATPAGLHSLFSYFKTKIGLGNRAFASFEHIFANEFGKTPQEFNLIDYFPEHSPKGLIIHDVNDELIPLDEAKTIATQWKNAQLLVTEGFGHSIKSNEIDQKIVNFLNNTITNG
jgi:hypothetical protein